MTVKIRFFAALREKAQRGECTLEVPDGATVSDVWAQLCTQYPAIEPMSSCVSFAVNRTYLPRSHRLAEGDELALIPPVSGG